MSNNAAPQSIQPTAESVRHTPTPWAYRPNEHDDWGWIRDADGNLAATARDGRVWSENFDQYRAAKTDPYEPNAAFIVEAVNSHASLKARVEELENLVDQAVYLINDARSGYVAGTRYDEQWDARKKEFIKARAVLPQSSTLAREGKEI